MTDEERIALRADLARELAAGVLEREWHWFSYHVCFVPPHPFARSLVEACLDCEVKLPGLGRQLIRDIGRIGGVDRHEPHYDQLMQKLAEILVLRQLLWLPWPKGTTFEHEPRLTKKGKRPELRVAAPGQTYLFEVKAPALLEHQRQRATNSVQLPTRMFSRQLVERIAGEGGLTLPRDNPVKDFLVDAEAKFAQFKAVGPAVSVLIIVWDDFIYEPITVLTQESCGLLTANSYHRTALGDPVGYPNIDAVMLVRHLLYFKNAAADRALGDREHAFDFGGESALPNVFVPLADGLTVPEFIRTGFRALPLDHTDLAHAAEYRPVEMVLWLNADGPGTRNP